jgi:integrase
MPLCQLVEEAVLRRSPGLGRLRDDLGNYGLRISEVAGLEVGDVDLARGLLNVRRQTYPGRGGLVTKETKGRPTAFGTDH